MGKYLVKWEIDIDDESVFHPEQAAATARDYQQRPSTATVFDVTDCATGKVHRVDLDQLERDSNNEG